MDGNSTPSTMEVDMSNTGELLTQPKPHPADYQALMGSLYEFPSLYDYEPIMGWYEPDPNRDSGSTRARCTRARCSYHIMIQTDCIRRLLHARDRQRQRSGLHRNVQQLRHAANQPLVPSMRAVRLVQRLRRLAVELLLVRRIMSDGRVA